MTRRAAEWTHVGVAEAGTDARLTGLDEGSWLLRLRFEHAATRGLVALRAADEVRDHFFGAPFFAVCAFLGGVDAGAGGCSAPASFVTGAGGAASVAT